RAPTMIPRNPVAAGSIRRRISRAPALQPGLVAARGDWRRSALVRIDLVDGVDDWLCLNARMHEGRFVRLDADSGDVIDLENGWESLPGLEDRLTFEDTVR